MTFLVRLYPAVWRERYGDEFTALLEDVRLTPFDVIDILLAALDAHLRPQPSVAARYPTKETFMNRKQYGYAAIAGGGLLSTLLVLGSVLPMPIREVSMMLYPVASVPLLLALAGLSAVPGRPRSGRAWLAFVLPAAGLLVPLAGIALLALLGDRPLVGALSAWHITIAGFVALLAGSLVFAGDALLVGTLERAAVTLLGVGATAGIATGVATIVAWSPAVGLVFIGSTLVYSIGWVWIGYSVVVRTKLADATSS